MASSGKPKTTRAKLQREAVLRERRLEKAARKRFRRLAQPDPSEPDRLDREAPERVDDESVLDASVPGSEPAANR
jgi:hypothetical protein